MDLKHFCGCDLFSIYDRESMNPKLPCDLIIFNLDLIINVSCVCVYSGLNSANLRTIIIFSRFDGRIPTYF